MAEAPAALLDRLGAAALECRALIREMHEAQQDLRAAARDARQAAAELRVAVDEAAKAHVDEAIEEVATVKLEEFGSLVRSQIDAASKRVLASFDELSAPLLASFAEMAVHVERLQRAQGLRA